METAQLPSPHLELLTHELSALVKAAKEGNGRVDDRVVADTLLTFMVRLLGNYRRFVRAGAGASSAADAGGSAGGGSAAGAAQSGAQQHVEEHCIHPDFDEEGFLADAPPSTESFLREMRNTQHFEVWWPTAHAQCPYHSPLPLHACTLLTACHMHCACGAGLAA